MSLFQQPSLNMRPQTQSQPSAGQMLQLIQSNPQLAHVLHSQPELVQQIESNPQMLQQLVDHMQPGGQTDLPPQFQLATNNSTPYTNSAVGISRQPTPMSSGAAYNPANLQSNDRMPVFNPENQPTSNMSDTQSTGMTDQRNYSPSFNAGLNSFSQQAANTRQSSLQSQINDYLNGTQTHEILNDISGLMNNSGTQTS